LRALGSADPSWSSTFERHDILPPVVETPTRNVYFELTEEFNMAAPNVALSSGQAVVYYRVAIMSKDGDWIIREAPDACASVLATLDARGARYRPGPPLDVRWLSGGWSSHFELFDARARRVRCDFVSRPPRVPRATLDALFDCRTPPTALHVVDVATLISLKRTQRAKDYAVIGELATRLPPEQEIEVTTDPDRLLALALVCGRASLRPAVRAARQSDNRRAVVVAIAEEIDASQQADRRRVAAYEAAVKPFLEACRAAAVSTLPLQVAHARLVEIAERLLPHRVDWEDGSANAQR
jgi:hypothetical protein